jgi:hypothetical protein
MISSGRTVELRLSGFPLTAVAAWSLSLVVSVLLMGCGPIGPLSGGRLSGEIGPPDVTDWSAHADDDTLHLETNPEDPHSVNTWFVAMGPKLYVPTSMILGPKDPTERTWVRNVEADPNVRLRIGGIVYDRVAIRIRVQEGSEYERARGALETKYDLDPNERDSEREIWIFRMDPRAA